MVRLLASLTLLLVLAIAPRYAVGDPAEAVIGGQSAQIELPDGCCAMSELEPSDARLIGFLRTANEGNQHSSSGIRRMRTA